MLDCSVRIHNSKTGAVLYEGKQPLNTSLICLYYFVLSILYKDRDRTNSIKPDTATIDLSNCKEPLVWELQYPYPYNPNIHELLRQTLKRNTNQ